MKLRSLIVPVIFGLNLAACGDAQEPVKGPMMSASSSALEHADDLVAQRCGGPLGLECGPRQFCRSLGDNRCPTEGHWGVCAPRPDLCTKEFKPFCGCDGKTYPNACRASAGGISVRHAGACKDEQQFCGGIAGIPCPGSGRCVDDPSDDCDPKTGGADCSGMCVCPVLSTCRPGFQWDSSPGVCGCVPSACPTNPCATVLCAPGNVCVAEGCRAVCRPQ
ncbi:MAG TPA: hypothetical protein VI072_06080 [Polyangiaceae bacterium]